MRTIFTAFLITLFLPLLQAQTSADAAVALSASVQSSPASVTVSWPMPVPVAEILLFRREKGAGWFALLDDSLSTASSFIDNFVTPGKTYEYGIQRVVNGVVAFGYISVALESPVVEQRGKVLVFVEQALTTMLATELDRLRYDLAGDGWNVVWHPVPANATVATIKSQVLADYNADPTKVNSVLLLGDLPVPYSGNTAWDGHGDHQGAWPADSYYGDIDGQWSDNTVNNTTPSRAANDNIPGDGKYDQSIVPSSSELAVGRVDFSNVSQATFGLNAVELMRRYLNKDHRWRVKQYTVSNKTLIDDNFGYFGGEAFAANGYRNGYALTGAANVVQGDFFNDTDDQSFLFGYGCGGGTYISADGVGNSGNFATDTVNVVFSMLFGSYHGDWDYSPDPFMPSALASNGGILTCGWAGRPHWFVQHMATGETIGYSAVETQNTCDNPGYPSYYGACGSHVALMGDPTLRAHVVAPASDLSASSQCGSVSLYWTASNETVAGYQIFRSAQPYSGYTKLNGTVVTTNSYTDNNPPAGLWYYQVRAVKLESATGGSSYWNSSTGAFTSVNYNGSTAPDISASGGLLTCYFAADTLRGHSSTPNVSYLWTGPNGFSSDLQNVAVTETGTYVLTVTGLNGCTSSTSVTVIEDTDPPVVSATATAITCTSPAQLSGNVTGGEPQWTGPNGYSSNLLNPTVNVPGVYTLVGLDIFNGCTASTTVTVAENYTTPADLTLVASSEINCAHAVVTLTASSTSNGTVFSWEGPGIVQQQGANSTVNQPGEYTVTATNPVTGCTAVQSIIVIQNVTLPDISAFGTILSCANPTGTISGNSTTPDVTYAWTGPGGFTSNLASPAVSVPGAYSLVVTAPNGCTEATSVMVNVDESVPNVSASGGLITCFTYNDTVRGNSTTPDVSYLWTGPNGFSFSGQNAAVTLPGTYFLMVTAPNGCTNSTAVEVTADLELPLVSVLPPDAINCATTSVTLYAGIVNGVPFWVGPNGFSSTELEPVVTAPGVYTVTAVSLLNGCTAEASVDVPDNTTPPAVVATGGILYCENSTVYLSAIVGPLVTVAWPGLPGGANPEVNSPGTYEVIAFDLSNGCTSTASAVVTQVSPFLSAALDPMLVNCDGSSTASVTANGGTLPYTYLWSNGANTQETTYPNGSNVLFVSVTDAGGCTEVLSADIPPTDPIAVTASATDVSESGGNDGTATATATGDGAPYTYLWSNGGTTQTITGLAVGTYTVTVTGVNGCTAEAFVVVDQMVATYTAPEGWSVRLAPNPANQYSWLELQFVQAQEVQVQVEDLAGRILSTNNVGAQSEHRIRLETGKLPTGLYLVRIFAGEKSFSMKLVKSE